MTCPQHPYLRIPKICYIQIISNGGEPMETKITYQTLFGHRIWTVSYYSQFSKRWVISGQFEDHADAMADARSWH
jgi:hypothetical protein